MQFMIGLDLCRYFASIFLRHCDVQQNQIRFETADSLVRLCGIVFLKHQIWAGSFEKDFYKMCAVRIVIDNQDPSFSLGR